MAKASVPTLTLKPSALGHHPSPGRTTALGKISPVVLQCLHASTAINQAAMDGINSPVSACAREGKGMNCKQGGPHPISYPSASVAPCLVTILLPFLYQLLSFFYLFFFHPADCIRGNLHIYPIPSLSGNLSTCPWWGGNMAANMPRMQGKEVNGGEREAQAFAGKRKKKGERARNLTHTH